MRARRALELSIPLGTSVWHQSPKIRVSTVCLEVGREVIKWRFRACESSRQEATATPTIIPLASFRGHWQLGSYQSYGLPGELAEDPTAGLHGATSDRLVAGGGRGKWGSAFHLGYMARA